MNTPLNTLGASNLSQKERAENDYYGTNPKCVEDLLAKEDFSDTIWEPTAGHHNIVDVLESHGYTVIKSDLVDYGFNDEQIDFLGYTKKCSYDIIFNPPYKLADEFIEHALDIIEPNVKLAAFLRLQFLEGQKRFEQIFKKNPPKTVYVYSKRQICSTEDEFDSGSSAVAYVWIVWKKGFTGDPVIRWIS